MALATSAWRDSLRAFLAHPGFQLGDQRRAPFLANGQPLVGRQAVDVALDVEQGVDPLHRFERNRRDDRRRAGLAPFAGRWPRYRPARRTCAARGPSRPPRGSAPGASPGGIELAVAAIGVGLQDAAPGGQMALGMLARAVARVEEHRRRRRPPAERPVVAHIGPTSPGVGLALGQHRHGGVVAMQALGGQDMGLRRSWIGCSTAQQAPT